MSHLADLVDGLAAVPGTVSVWFGPAGGPPRYARQVAQTHYAASTMKVAVLGAVYRLAEAGQLSLDAEVRVHNDFASAAPGAPRFSCRQSYDNDDAVWERLGATAQLGWLCERMITRSSNLATNIVLELVGTAAVNEVWRAVGAAGAVVGRGIEDAAAASHGITNLVTAADLAALFGGLANATVASDASCTAMIETLLAQERGEDIAAGLPTGTRVAHKNGWIDGLRHGAALVFPDDAPPFVLIVCLTSPIAIEGEADEACQLVARIAAAAWADR